MGDVLSSLQPGMPIVFGGDRVAHVSEELAAAFAPGDRLVVVQETGDLLHIPSSEWDIANGAVGEASRAFSQLGSSSDTQITAFYERFAALLGDDDTFAVIADANREDVSLAKERGRSTTRLVLTERMRAEMIEGLRIWAKTDAGLGDVEESIEHAGWRLDLVRSGLGVVGFVFEGRPNVLADATGVLRSGNSVVFRIGSDALTTARAVMKHALAPALAESGLPLGSVSLIDSPSRATAWAMFSDPRLSLAVARGSGPAVSQLGSVARQAGIPVSLHGTGGAWVVVASSAPAEVLSQTVVHSLDRKVCNTLNTICIVTDRAQELVPVFLNALDVAGTRRAAVSKLHVTDSALPLIPKPWFDEVTIRRANGPTLEPRAEPISSQDLDLEWEWEESPEVTLTLVADVEEAVELFNEKSPRLVASLISDDVSEHEQFFRMVDAPFVGNGFTRWVDGQYALGKPELGLSNWQHGRLLGRGGILSGDSVYTVRARLEQHQPDLGR